MLLEKNISNNQRAVGVFSSRSDLEKALQGLKKSGFDMNNVVVITHKNSEELENYQEEEKEKIGNKADEGATAGALTGGALGTLTGLLVGLGALAIPGIGPILLAGAEATALATTLAGAAIGIAAGSLLGTLVGLGIPEERAKVYSDRIEAGDYLVIIKGNDATQAYNILSKYGIEEWGIYHGGEPENMLEILPTSQPQNLKGDRQTMKLYEERLIPNNNGYKTGDVTIDKLVNTKTARVKVPVEKERIVIENNNDYNGASHKHTHAFKEGEVARVALYQEEANIHKQTFVSEEVKIRKQVERDTVVAKDRLRREEIDIKINRQ